MAAKTISPSAMAKASACLHTWFLECFGDPSQRREPDAGMLLMRGRGLDHERERVKTLPEYAEPTWDGKDWDAGHQSTLALMREGRPWIYQGVLRTESYRGVPDLLKREEGTSNLGTVTYVPIDMKGHKEVTPKDRTQLLGYSMLLEPVLGVRPTRGGIWLNTGEIEWLDLQPQAAKFEALLAEMDRVRRGDLRTTGRRCDECRNCPWFDVCSDGWKSSADVCLLYGVTGATAKKLAGAGMPSWKDVAAADPDRLAQAGIKGEKAQSVWLHAQAWATGKPQVRKPPTFPSDVPIHFYDIETYGDCTYLHGDVRVFGDEREEKQFLARDPSQEKDAWHGFLDYVGKDKSAIVYCWANYEKGFVARLGEKYGGNADGRRHMEGLKDQCAFVKEHLALPVSGYGIKAVAPIFGFHWTAEDAGGLNSESWYEDWLEKGDEAVLEKILRYNLDDVLAMETIDRALRGLDSRS